MPEFIFKNCLLRFIRLLRIAMLTAMVVIVSCLKPGARNVQLPRVTLTLKNAPLTEVFKQVRQQTGYDFFYRSDWMKQTVPVNIEVKEVPVTEALDICFKAQPFTYTIEGTTITLQPRPRNENETVSVAPAPGLKGIVMDENGKPMQGVSVSLKKSSRGTSTNEKGEFTIADAQPGEIMLVSFVGYESQEIPLLSGRTELIIRLRLAINTLDELQVIAYGKSSRRLSTGNVSTVSAKDIEKQPVNNPLLALQGRVPGMEITQRNGLPGTGVRVQIRGQNSITNGNDPLYVIDGVPYSANNPASSISRILGPGTSREGSQGSPFSFINPADIESISILKDADATAIYGTRGANGVVLITTKKGKAGVMKFDSSLQRGNGWVPKELQLLNTRQYLDMRYQAFRNDGASPNPNADYDLTLWDTTRYTDWQKELIGRAAQFTDVQLSVSGGTANVQYLIGAGYHQETTVFPGNFADTKGSVNFNIQAESPDKKLGILLSGMYLSDDNRLPYSDLTEYAVKLAPNAPSMYSPDGTINWAPNSAGISSWQSDNPATQLLIRFRSLTSNLVSNATVSYKPLEGLEIKTALGYTTTLMDEILPLPLAATDPALRPTTQRSSLFIDNSVASWIIEPQLIYTKNFPAGQLTALAGLTLQRNKSISRQLRGIGFSSDLLLEDLRAATTVQSSLGSYAIYKYAAGFGRITFNRKNKYLLNLTARRDGSGRFGPDSRFQNFGSIGAGWNFAAEKFSAKYFPVLSYGKLRASFGTTGSDQVGDYTFMDLYNAITGLGVPYQGSAGTRPDLIFTPDLAWELTTKLEGALELGFLQDRLLFSASFYRNRSSNQLVSYSLPSTTGFTSVRKNLDALVQNKGWEFELQAAVVNTTKIRWTTAANLSVNRNKLLKGSPGLSDNYQRRVGYPLSTSFVYRFMGVDPVTGLYVVADSHGNPTTSPDPATDRTLLLDFTAKFFGGWQNTLSYGDFTLDFLIQIVNRPVIANYLFNYMPGYFGAAIGSNQPATVLQRWQTPGDVTTIQRFSQNTSTLNTMLNARESDMMYGNGSFVRLRNASFSWLMPERLRKKAGLQNVRLFLQGQNLLTITSFQGFDPESGSTDILPPLRVITFGIQISR